MRYPASHKPETRERIIRAAARQFRERGFGATGVASVMKEAELTHGGFYAYFDSKDALIADVLREGFNEPGDRLEARLDHLDGDAWLDAWVDGYLSDGHVESVGSGCPLPSLTAEVARAGDTAQQAFSDTMRRRLDRVAPHVDAPRAEAEQRIMTAYAQMAGALMLARALPEPTSSDLRASAAASAKSILKGHARGGRGGSS